jgi:hypothetical protein
VCQGKGTHHWVYMSQVSQTVQSLFCFVSYLLEQIRFFAQILGRMFYIYTHPWSRWCQWLVMTPCHCDWSVLPYESLSQSVRTQSQFVGEPPILVCIMTQNIQEISSME